MASGEANAFWGDGTGGSFALGFGTECFGHGGLLQVNQKGEIIPAFSDLQRAHSTQLAAKGS